MYKVTNLDKSTEPHGIVPLRGADVGVQEGGVGRHPRTDEGTLRTPNRYMLANEAQQLRVLAESTATFRHLFVNRLNTETTVVMQQFFLFHKQIRFDYVTDDKNKCL